MAREYSRAAEFHRAERNPHFGQRPEIPSCELAKCPRSGIPGTGNDGGRGARTHSQDSRADALGCLRPQRSGCTFGNQEVHALLPHAKARHLTYQQEFTSLIAASPPCGDRSSDQFKSAAALVITHTPAISSPVDLNPKLSDTQ